MNSRYEWVDQARGLGIFLVVYAHNYPFLESYIYSFHMPLFFFISGMFHPQKKRENTILKRAKSILIPYFIWSLLLYIFWLVLGRHFGNSVNLNLDPINGLIGVFYAQGDVQFMDWGIPMWFLPCLFVTFLLFYLIQSIKLNVIKFIFLISAIILGFINTCNFGFKLPWSLDVALVSLVFYAPGFYLKNSLVRSISNKKLSALIGVFFIGTLLALLNSKVDMYRSTYGIIPIFIVAGISGALCIILLFKKIKNIQWLGFLGRNTIPVLALQFRALTIIKAGLICFGIAQFNFNEPTKFILTIAQILLIWPAILIVNKYLPILNGKFKR